MEDELSSDPRPDGPSETSASTPEALGRVAPSREDEAPTRRRS